MSETEAPYFINHERGRRFPWSLYHRDLDRRLARAIARTGRVSPRVLVVGCGLEPRVDLQGRMSDVQFFACDSDARAIAECKKRYPEMEGRLAVCPTGNELPTEPAFMTPFDVVLAKEVVEHLPSPEPWAQALAARVALGGALLLTTPNYGSLSLLGLLERTVLEAIARRDGYSRANIHPTKFTRRRLSLLDVGPGMQLVRVETTWTGWALLGHWKRVA